MERYNKDKRNSEREKAPEGVVAGRNAVMEQLKAGTPIDKVFVASGEREGSIKLICALVLEKGIPLLECDKNKLDRLAGGSWHQGVVAMVAEKEYCTLDDLFAIAASKGEAPFFVIGDGITDPHNLGALIRCAEGAGAHGVILSKRHCAGLTPVAAKASAGALAHMAVAKVSNIASTVTQFFNIVHMSMGAAIAIIVGNLLGAGHLEEAVDTDRKMIAFAIFCSLGAGALLAALAPLFPKIYNTTDEVRTLAAFMLIVSAILMPFCTYACSAYFTLRSGGRVFITFVFDSIYMWAITVPLAFILTEYTSLSIYWIYPLCQGLEILKCFLGYGMLKQKTWVRRLVVDDSEVAEEKTA